MYNQVYTIGRWRVKGGRQQDFIDAWIALGETFASLPDPPGRGTLLQSATDPTLFYSFGPWSSMEAVSAMRNDPHAGEGIRKLVELCTEATPGTFIVVAEST